MFKNADDQSQIVTMQEVIDHHDNLMNKAQTNFAPTNSENFVPADEEELQDEGEQNLMNKVNDQEEGGDTD